MAGPKRTPLARALGVLPALYIGAVYVFLLTPILLIVLLSLNAGEFLAFPPEGLSFRWYVALAKNEAFMRAIRTSLLIATIATIVSTLIGTPPALYFVRHGGRARDA